MSREDKIEGMREDALEIKEADPQRALEQLKVIVEKYSDTPSVDAYDVYLAASDMLSIARDNEWWAEAAQAAESAARLRPEHSKTFEMEAHAYRLRDEGKEYEALEVLLELSGAFSPTPQYHAYGKDFAEIGAHDRAWRLYNQAIGEAAKTRASTHYIRKDMTDLLLKEDKPNHAVEMMITAFHEAELLVDGEPPAILERYLRKALRAAGFNMRLKKHRDLPDGLIDTCESQGREAAVELFYAWKEAGEEPEGWKAQIVEEPGEQAPQDQDPSLLKRLLGWAKRDE